MQKEINKRRLFNASSLALVVTALSFAIRANLLGELGTVFGLTPTEVGQTASAAFWGFTIAMFAGGPLCDFIGMKNMYRIAFFGHMAGILLTIFATGFWTLFFSTLLIGLGNGFIEATSYSMVTGIYTDNKAKKINDWHIWFPAGIVIGGLAGYLLTSIGASWKLQMLVMIPPTLVYGYMFYNQQFPQSERVAQGVSNKQMIRECSRPLFLFMVFCMFLTGATELGTNQWIAELLAAVGVPSILLLVFINGIMVLGRANAGFVLKRLSTPGLLFFSAVLSCAGLLWLGYAHGITAFAAAAVFAAGVCFFWPTMIGFVSENLPKTGPLGLSIMGGTGLLSTSLILPYFGQVYEWRIASKVNGEAATSFFKNALSGTREALEWSSIKLAAGAETLWYAAFLPAVLVIAFGILYFARYKHLTKAIKPSVSARKQGFDGI